MISVDKLSNPKFVELAGMVKAQILEHVECNDTANAINNCIDSLIESGYDKGTRDALDKVNGQ